MWRPGLVAMLVLAGCDAVWGLRSFPDATTGPADAGEDAPLPLKPCLNRTPPPIFCGDFDENPPPTFYINNIPSGGLLLTNTNATAVLRPASTTGPNAYWVTSTGGGLASSFDTAVPMVNTLEAKFALWILSTKPNAGSAAGLIRLQLGAGNYVDLDASEETSELRIEGFIGGSNPAKNIPLPLGWVEVDFWFDGRPADAQAGFTLNGGPVISIPFGVGNLPMVAPHLEFGIGGSGHDGLSVGYDDLSVAPLP